jgi:hypothetical protein
MKKCIKCNLNNAYSSKNIQYSYCKECQSVITKQWRIDNIEKVKQKAKLKFQNLSKESKRNSKYLNRYGITLQNFIDMEVEQKGLCAICGNPPSGKKKVLCVDHCHDTGKVRGLLCDDCNNLLGRAKDKIEHLLSAVEYLQKQVAK